MIAFAWIGCAAEPPAEPWSLPYVMTVVPWVQDSTGHWDLVDTASPRTQLRPDVVDARPGERSVRGWSAGELRPDEPIVVSDALPQRLLDVEARGEIANLGGLVGADLLLTQPFWLDPRGSHLYFGAPPFDAPVAGRAAFELAGGGSTCLDDGVCFDFDPTRILVEVEVDGEVFTLLLDTASTYLTLEPRAAEALGAPLVSFDAGDGPMEVFAATARLGDAVADDLPVLVADEELTTSLVRLELEVDRPVDGILGHSFLERFLLGVDAPSGELTVSTYLPGTWEPVTDWVTPGFRLAESDGDCFVPAYVIEGSGADRVGIVAGDCLTAIDGLTPGSASIDEVVEHIHTIGAGGLLPVAWEGGEDELEIRDWSSSER